MASEAENVPEEAGFVSGIFQEIVNSPLNIVLIAIITFLIFKIFKSRQPPKPSPPSEPELPKLRRDFTVAELKAYDGKQPDGRVLVAVNGTVYDVTRGKRFYGPGEWRCTFLLLSPIPIRYALDSIFFFGPVLAIQSDSQISITQLSIPVSEMFSRSMLIFTSPRTHNYELQLTRRCWCWLRLALGFNWVSPSVVQSSFQFIANINRFHAWAARDPISNIARIFI